MSYCYSMDIRKLICEVNIVYKEVWTYHMKRMEYDQNIKEYNKIYLRKISDIIKALMNLIDVIFAINYDMSYDIGHDYIINRYILVYTRYENLRRVCLETNVINVNLPELQYDNYFIQYTILSMIDKILAITSFYFNNELVYKYNYLKKETIYLIRILN